MRNRNTHYTLTTICNGHTISGALTRVRSCTQGTKFRPVTAISTITTRDLLPRFTINHPSSTSYRRLTIFNGRVLRGFASNSSAYPPVPKRRRYGRGQTKLVPAIGTGYVSYKLYTQRYPINTVSCGSFAIASPSGYVAYVHYISHYPIRTQSISTTVITQIASFLETHYSSHGRGRLLLWSALPFRGHPRHHPCNKLAPPKGKRANATTRPRLPKKRLNNNNGISRVKTIKLRGANVNRRKLYRLKGKSPREGKNRILTTNGIMIRRVINALRVLSIHGKRNPRARNHNSQSSQTMFQLNNPIRRNYRLLQARQSVRMLRHIRPRHFMNVNHNINRGNRQDPRAPTTRLYYHLRTTTQINNKRLGRMRLMPKTHFLLLRRNHYTFRLLRGTNVNPTNVVFRTITLRPTPRREIQTTRHGIGSRVHSSFPSTRHLVFTP